MYGGTLYGRKVKAVVALGGSLCVKVQVSTRNSASAESWCQVSQVSFCQVIQVNESSVSLTLFEVKICGLTLLNSY